MSDEPVQIGTILSQVVGAAVDAAADDEKRRAWEVAERQRREDDFHRKVASNWQDFSRRIGPRYTDCTLDNFVATTAEQKQVVANLLAYAENVKANCKAGRGLLLFGPKGTGKDHLITAVAKYVLAAGGSVAWRNGVDLFGDIRDAIAQEGSERDFVASLVRPDVFYLSDPLPPSGKLTEFQSSMLFRILDGRYRAMRPTLVTVNATGRQDLEDRLGAQNADRLRDGTLTLFCGWPSYRKPADVVK
jgi:DNA replication protein DnaC